MKSTAPMRSRVRELAIPPRDDFDRAVLAVLDDYDAIVAALGAILIEPHGCVFCDSGTLRNPKKSHESGCGFALAQAALAHCTDIRGRD